jgi:hypothetical protein
MSRSTTTERLQINIITMCQFGMIPKNGWNSGRYVWYQDGQEISYVNYSSSVGPNGAVVRFKYNITYSGGETKNINQPVELEGVDCHLGGFRWYFKCSACSRRVAVLYSGTQGFFCRKCNNLAYDGQNDAKSSRGGLFSLFDLTDKEERLMRQIKRPYYNGKPTKKHLQLLKLRQTGVVKIRSEIQKGI